MTKIKTEKSVLTENIAGNRNC